MSNILIPVKSAGHWAFGASAMSRSLKRVIHKKSIEEDDIPKGIYSGMKDFFSFFLQDTPRARTDENYKIALSVLKTMKNPPKTSREKNDLIKVIALFVEDLGVPHSLTPEKIRVAQQAQEFFSLLSQKGEEEKMNERNRRSHEALDAMVHEKNFKGFSQK